MRTVVLGIVAFATAILCTNSGRAQEGSTRLLFEGWRAETWFYFRNNSESSDYSQQAKVTLRLYQPVDLGEGWRLTLREDIPGIRTNQIGEDNKAGQWLTNIGDIFVQGSLATPPIARRLNADLGMRVIFPTGGLKPFGDGYYQVAPHFGLDWKAPGDFAWLGLAPLVRYFRTVGAPVPHGTEISQVQFHPVVSLRLGERWSIRFWEENAIVYDTLTGGLFVPIDAYIAFRIDSALSLAVGGAVRTHGSYAQYDNMVYSRLGLTF
jgi:hypothetical protein